jgi:hypothetical protein
MLPKKNRNQNPRRALKTQSRQQNISKIFLVLETVDAEFVEQIGGQDPQAEANELRSAKEKHKFVLPRFFRHRGSLSRGIAKVSVSFARGMFARIFAG